MLISLNDDLVANNGHFSNSEIFCFANLALAAIEGNHLIVCGRSLSRMLAFDARLGGRERAFYARSIEEYTSLGAALHSAIRYINVSNSVVKTKECLGDGRQRINLPLSHFSSSNSLAPTRLVCENLNDCRWLKAATSALMRTTIFRRSSLSLSYVAGGGDTTSEVLQDILSNSTALTVCVVDSDKKPGSWKLGETAKKVSAVADSAELGRLEFILLDCHELENLTPDELLDDPRSRIHLACRDTGRRVAKLTEVGLRIPRLHIDMKNGLKLSDVFDSCRDTSFHHDWRDFIEAVKSNRLDLHSNCATCAQSGRCLSAPECECVICRPLGGKLLMSVEEMWNRSGRELWHGLPEMIRQILSEVCHIVLSFGCSTPRRSV
jgi:hypothetical protein